MTEVWNSDYGYLVHKTHEIKTEVEKILKLWNESDSLRGYCPHAREDKLYEYNNPNFQIGTVAEHTGVVFIALFRKD